MEYIKRELEEEVLKRLRSNLITAIIGPRQVGKTTLLMKIKEYVLSKGVVPEDVAFYFTFDESLLRMEISNNFKFLETEIEKSIGEAFPGKKGLLLIIDEVQKAPQIFDWLKIIYDNYKDRIKIILSGSSSPAIKKGSVETLAGRITFLKMYPFTLREMISDEMKIELPDPLWKSLPASNMKDYFLTRQALLYKHKEYLDKLLERILILGSLPAVYTAKTSEEKSLHLSSMVDTYLERDIRALGEVGNINDYTNLLKTISFEIGSTFNLASISKDLGIAYNTIKKYISILKDTFILNAVPPLLQRGRKQLVKSDKIYFFDVGVSNFLAKRTEKEHIHGKPSGFIFENILIKSFEAANENQISSHEQYFWRDYEGHEIDFVVEKDAGRYIPIEISLGKDFPKNKIKNFSVFFEKFKETSFGIMVYRGDFKEEKIEGKPVYLIPWWLWW